MFTIPLCLLLLTLPSLQGDAPLPEQRAFMEELRKSMSTPDKLLSEYTYTYKEMETTLDSAGKAKKTEMNVYQVINGAEPWETYERQIIKNGNSLTDKELQKQDLKERERVQKERSKRAKWSEEKRRQEREKADQKDRETNDDVFASFEYQLVGREYVNGRPTILVNFKPNRSYKPKTDDARELQHVAGRLWISEDDHQLAKLEAEVIEPIKFLGGFLAKLQKGSTVAFELQKINDEIWLPVRGQIVYDARVLLLKGMRGRVDVEFSDHKKFNVDTTLEFKGPVNN